MGALVRFIGGFDWIDPAAELAQAVMRGEMGKVFSTDDPSDCADAMALLNKYGIAVWGHGYNPVGDQWCFKVSKNDYGRACFILEKYGWEFG